MNLLSRREALLLGACAFNLKAQEPVIPKIDLFPQFLKLWPASPAGRVDRFLELIVKPHIDLYDAFVGDISPERATRYMQRVEPLVPVIASIHTWVADGFDSQVAVFQKQIPDFHWRGTLVFMPNLFTFDAGGGGPIDGKDLLIVGLDTIAKIDGPHAELSVLISHELFHKYHGSLHPAWADQNRGIDAPLFRLIWTAGLATYASQRLNPGKSLDAVFRSATLAPSWLAMLF